MAYPTLLGIVEVNEEEEEDESPPEDSLEDEPKDEKIIEEDIIGGPSSNNKSCKSDLRSQISEQRNSRRSSEEDLPRQPCSFFISTSPPLPHIAATSITSELSSEDQQSRHFNLNYPQTSHLNIIPPPLLIFY